MTFRAVNDENENGRYINIESPDGFRQGGSVTLWLTQALANDLRRALDELYPPVPASEPFIVDPVRDAAPTLGVEELRTLGVSLCAATADESAHTRHAAVPVSSNELVARAHAQTLDFVAAKLGLPI
jgi:hypothetical protein